MRILISLLILLLSLPAYGLPTQLYGSVEHNNVHGKVNTTRLKGETGQQDYRAPLPAHVQKDYLRGYLGVRFARESGQLTYIYAKSDLNRLGVHQGAFIIKIDRALYRPCQMTNVVLRYKNDYIVLTIREGNKIREVIVRLKSAKELGIERDIADSDKEPKVCN